MSVYRVIKTSRRLIVAGAVLGYAVALTFAASSLISGEANALAALAFLAVFAIPPSLAVLSLDRRPSLLTLASMAALIQGVLLIADVVGLLMFIPAILWYLAGRRRPRPVMTPRGTTWKRPLLALASIVPLLALTMHLDPICTITGEDGALIREYENEGAPTGWSLQLATTSSGSTSGGETTTCSTNSIATWEPVVSLLLTATYIVVVGLRWPTTEDLAEVDRAVISN